jgi:hypothetical protein
MAFAAAGGDGGLARVPTWRALSVEPTKALRAE